MLYTKLSHTSFVGWKTSWCETCPVRGL